MDFVYKTDYTEYNWLLDMKIADTFCKHVLRLNSHKSNMYWDECKRVGVDVAMWGYGSGLWRNEEANRTFQLHRIGRMIYKNFDMPFRVVIDETGMPWVDNLHCSLRDIMKYGADVKFGDVRCYIVDMRYEMPVVIDVNGSVSNSVSDIKGCLVKAEERCKRITQNMRDINYTIRDFIKDNNIARETLFIDGAVFKGY